MSNPAALPLTRLDRAIRRLEAQRAVLDWAAAAIAAIPGPVIELGLGNGRSFDHLRARVPGRDLWVFERHPQAHPDSTPAAERLIVGNLEDTLPAARLRFGGQVALLHSDIGTGDDDRNRHFAAWLAPFLPPLLRAGGIVASDQELVALSEQRIALPEGVEAERYYLYKMGL